MKNLFEKCRSIRRYDRSVPLTREELLEVISVVTRIASAGNLQRIRYRVITADAAQPLFGKIALGAYLAREEKPTEDVAPTAYVVLLTEGDAPDLNLAIDIGIAAEAIALSAAHRGIGSCMIRNFNVEAFSPISEKSYTPRLVIALGYPAERAEAVAVTSDGSLRYRRDPDGVVRVPKLSLDELLID